VRTIENNGFYFTEILDAYNNLVIANPSATTYFRDNFLRSVHTHASHNVGWQIGQSATNASRITNNTFIVYHDTDSMAGQIGLQVRGSNNSLKFLTIGPSLNTGVKFEASSSNNVLAYGTIQATTPIVNLGTNNSYGPAGAGAGAASASAVPTAQELALEELTNASSSHDSLPAGVPIEVTSRQIALLNERRNDFAFTKLKHDSQSKPRFETNSDRFALLNAARAASAITKIGKGMDSFHRLRDEEPAEDAHTLALTTLNEYPHEEEWDFSMVGGCDSLLD
jgi:hypothetical protein